MKEYKIMFEDNTGCTVLAESKLMAYRLIYNRYGNSVKFTIEKK